MTYQKHSPRLAASLVLLGTTALATPALADDVLMPKNPYRAEMVVTSEGQNIPLTMYHSKSKMRIEMSPEGRDVVQIIDLVAGEAFMLMDMGGQKRAMKVDVDDAVSRFGLGSSSLGRATGTKKIAGNRCKTYVIESATVCLTRHNIALESVSPEGTARVTKLKIGRQTASLFIVPSDYTVIDMSGFGGGMGGSTADTFKDRDSVMNGLLGRLGMADDVSILEGINAVTDAEDDEAAGQAAMDALLGLAGVPEVYRDEMTTDTTTADVLIQGLDGLLFENDAERAKAAEMAAENERQTDLVRNEGMEALWRDQGMSEEQISQMIEGQKKLQAMFDEDPQVARDRARAKEKALAERLGGNPSTTTIEAEENAIDSLAEDIMADGVVTDAEKDALEKQAQDAIARLLGEK